MGDRAGPTTAPPTHAAGFRPVLRLRLPRRLAVRILEENPLLTARGHAAPAENPMAFLKLTLAVHTDVTGREFFEGVDNLSCDPRHASSFTWDLAAAGTASLPPLRDLAARFAAGEGRYLVVNMIQQTLADETSVVTWDDVRLLPRS